MTRVQLAVFALSCVAWVGFVSATGGAVQTQERPKRYHVQRIETVSKEAWIYQIKDTKTNTCWAVFRADGMYSETGVRLDAVPCD